MILGRILDRFLDSIPDTFLDMILDRILDGMHSVLLQGGGAQAGLPPDDRCAHSQRHSKPQGGVRGGAAAAAGGGADFDFTFQFIHRGGSIITPERRSSF